MNRAHIKKMLFKIGLLDATLRVHRSLLWWNPQLIARFVLLRLRYRHVLKRLRQDFGKRKLKVVFVIGEPSKWKCQLIYDQMLASEVFDPYVAPTIVDIGFLEDRFQPERVRTCREYFEKKHVRCVDVISLPNMVTKPLGEVKPDIVIYTQPWGMAENQCPIAVSQYALTFYAPYYIAAVGNEYSQLTSPFHRSLYGNFLENEQWVSYYKKLYWFDHLFSKMIPCGCPFREEIARYGVEVAQENIVIYAPHWTFPQKGVSKEEEFSTFLETGHYLLEFAKRTHNVEWVFKPHPVLKDKLIQSGVWSKSEVEQYYAEWATIGEVCEDGDYAKLFARSCAMITDSLSFLAEYLIVNRPLIRLEPKGEVRPFMPPAQGKLDAMYRVHTIEELQQVLERVIVNGDDYMRNVRTDVIHKLGYDQNDVACQMINKLTEIVSGK